MLPVLPFLPSNNNDKKIYLVLENLNQSNNLNTGSEVAFLVSVDIYFN